VEKREFNPKFRSISRGRYYQGIRLWAERGLEMAQREDKKEGKAEDRATPKQSCTYQRHIYLRTHANMMAKG